MPLVPYQLSLRHTPKILGSLLKTIPEDRWTEPGKGDRFSLLEVVCHMADFEEVFLDRIQAAIETEVPTFESIDISDRAVKMGYRQRDLPKELASFMSRRRDTIRYLESLGEDQLARELIQSFGRMTVKDFVSVIAGHDLYHIEGMTDYLEAAS